MRPARRLKSETRSSLFKESDSLTHRRLGYAQVGRCLREAPPLGRPCKRREVRELSGARRCQRVGHVGSKGTGKEHDPGNEPGPQEGGRVGGQSFEAPRQEGWVYSAKSFGISATMERMSFSVSSPLKAWLTLTFCSFHIRTVTSAFLAIS